MSPFEDSRHSGADAEGDEYSACKDVLDDAVAEVSEQEMPSVLVHSEEDLKSQKDLKISKDEIEEGGEGDSISIANEVAIVSEINVNSILDYTNGSSYVFVDGKVVQSISLNHPFRLDLTLSDPKLNIL